MGRGRGSQTVDADGKIIAVTANKSSLEHLEHAYHCIRWKALKETHTLKLSIEGGTGGVRDRDGAACSGEM